LPHKDYLLNTNTLYYKKIYNPENDDIKIIDEFLKVC